MAGMIKKLKQNKKGFTIFEMLVAVAIMGFVFAASFAGITVGSNAYRQFDSKSESEAIMMESITAMSHAIRCTNLTTGIQRKIVDGQERYIFENTEIGFTGYYRNLDNGIAFTSNIDSSKQLPVIIRRDGLNGIYVQIDNMDVDPNTSVVTITLKTFQNLRDNEGRISQEELSCKTFTVTPLAQTIERQY